MEKWEVEKLELQFAAWYAQQQAKHPKGACGYSFRFVDPRRFPGWPCEEKGKA